MRYKTYRRSARRSYKRKVFDLDEDGELITADDTSDEDSQTTQSIDSQELTPMILTDPKPVKQSQK